MGGLKTATAGLAAAVVILSGCTSGRPPLGLSALTEPETEPNPAVTMQADASATGTGIAMDASGFEATEGEAAYQTAAASTGAHVQLAPVIGAPAEAIPPMSRRLSARAAERGIGIVGADSGATHVMKGYFSAISEGGETTVIFVWDVLDPAGNRLHRIQGQQKAPGGRGDGWSSVTASTMESIAVRTVDDLAVWLSQRQG